MEAKERIAITNGELEKLKGVHEKMKQWEKALGKESTMKMEGWRRKEFARKGHKEQKLYTPESLPCQDHWNWTAD